MLHKFENVDQMADFDGEVGSYVSVFHCSTGSGSYRHAMLQLPANLTMRNQGLPEVVTLHADREAEVYDLCIDLFHGCRRHCVA
jgi:hypothetical protein